MATTPAGAQALAMVAKRSYSAVLAAAAAAAFSLQAGVPAAAESPTVSGSDQSTDDTAVTARVKAALAADHQLVARHIDVSVRHGVVYLGGVVESEQDLRLAELDAKSVPGVSQVDNRIELKATSNRGPD